MSKNEQSLNVWSLFGKIVELVKSEVTTFVGRVNLLGDLILAAVVVAIFAANTFVQIAIVIASIWNKEISKYLSSADTLTAFIILVAFFVACLIFLYFSEKILSRNKAKPQTE